MKHLGVIALTSLISALLSIFIYRNVADPQKILIKESLPVRYVNPDDPTAPPSASHDYSFAQAGPLGATDFISAAELVTPTVVNIKTSQAGAAALLLTACPPVRA